MTLQRLISSTKILVGLVSGVIVGLFFGEYASVLKVVADGFVKLLQMTVLPYITLSIVTSLGKNPRAPSRGCPHWLLVPRFAFHVPHSLGLPRRRDGVIFQHYPRRTAPTV
jgi:hypothetical protein